MSYVYLASPYSHPDVKIRHVRLLSAMEATAWLLKQGTWVYSPIVHCHDLALRHDLPKEFDFWQHYNRAMLTPATALYLLNTSGLAESKGVKAELEYAIRDGKLIHVLTPELGGYKVSRYEKFPPIPTE